MEITQLFTTLLVVACGAFGWFGRALYSETQSLRKGIADLKDDITNLRVMMSAEYIKYDRFKQEIDPLSTSVEVLKKDLYQKR